MIKLIVKTQSAAEIPSELLVVPVFSPAKETDTPQGLLSKALIKLDTELGGSAQAALQSGDFKAGLGQRSVTYATEKGAKVTRLMLYGLGPAENFELEDLRNLAGTAAQEAQNRKIAKISILGVKTRRFSSEACAKALTEGLLLGAYRYDRYKTTGKKKKAALQDHGSLRQVSLIFEGAKKITELRNSVNQALITSRGQNLARDLSNAPANALPPAVLAREARRVARETGLACRVLKGAELERGGFEALMAVGQGSENPPQFIVLEHRGARNPKSRKIGTLCLVGKGITFDSGGISIKPSAGMQDMKHDMSGAAAVIGAMQAIAELRLPVHVVGLVAAAENMPGGRAYRPGDVIGSRAGKTIEITNTDAEGRLVLADALDYAVDQYSPRAMIDLATLTGACMIALGEWATGCFANDRALQEELAEAGDETGECMWPMPLFPDHLRIMKSSIADLKNSGTREAGASTAAAFLKEFVGDTPWAHLDIAGTGWKSPQNSYHSTGATGVAVRTLVRWVEDRVQQNE